MSIPPMPPETREQLLLSLEEGLRREFPDAVITRDYPRTAVEPARQPRRRAGCDPDESPERNEMQTTDDLLTTRDVAQLLQISSQRVRQLVLSHDDFPAPAVTSRTARGVGTRRWRRDDVERYHASATRPPGRRVSAER